MKSAAQSLRPDAVAEPIDEEVDRLLDLGLRNRWYAIYPSELVKNTPVGLLRLGERIVAWRDHRGQAHVLADRCPHRAAPLSLGFNAGDRLRCAYHGVEIGGDGCVLRVPAEPGCALEGRHAVKSYPTTESRGVIFTWFGDALHPEATPFVPPLEFRDEAYEVLSSYYEWQTTWHHCYENTMDPMHGSFLHARSHTMYRGDSSAAFRTRDTESGFMFEKTGQRDVNFDWAEWCDDGALSTRAEIPYGPSGGPGGSFGIIHYFAPIDARSMAGFSCRYRKVSGWERDAWRFLYRNRLEARHWAVLEQDRTMVEALEPDTRPHESLYSHDAGIVRARRWLHNEARRQLRELKAAGLA